MDLDKSLFDFLESKGLVYNTNIHNDPYKIVDRISEKIVKSLNPILDGLPLYNSRGTSGSMAKVRLVIRFQKGTRLTRPDGYFITNRGRYIELIFSEDSFGDIFNEENRTVSGLGSIYNGWYWGIEAGVLLSDKILHSVVVSLLQSISKHYVDLKGSTEYSKYGKAHHLAFEFNRVIKQYAFSKTGATRAVVKRNLRSEQDVIQFMQMFSDLKSYDFIPAEGQIKLSMYQDAHRRVMVALQNFVANNQNQVESDILESSRLFGDWLLAPYLVEAFSPDTSLAPSCAGFLSGEAF